MAWTTADSVLSAWIGDDKPSDAALVGTWIGKAERLIRSRVPTIQARITAGEVDLMENAQDVVSAMVQRVFRNPEGVRTRQESTGPFGGSVTYGGDQPGSLSLTDDEASRLSPASASRGVFTVDTIPVSSEFSPNYAPVVSL